MRLQCVMHRPMVRFAIQEQSQAASRKEFTRRISFGYQPFSIRFRDARQGLLRKVLIPIRFQIYHLVTASGWGSHSLRTTQGRLISSLMSPQPYNLTCLNANSYETVRCVRVTRVPSSDPRSRVTRYAILIKCHEEWQRIIFCPIAAVGVARRSMNA